MLNLLQQQRNSLGQLMLHGVSWSTLALLDHHAQVLVSDLLNVSVGWEHVLSRLFVVGEDGRLHPGLPAVVCWTVLS